MGTLTAAEIAAMRAADARQRALRDGLELQRRGIIAPDVDDEPVGELDEQSAALLQALEELSGEERARAFDAAKHPRNPKGAPGGGRFRSLVDRLKDALTEHQKSGGKGDPFEGFDREQLRRVAKARGIKLKRGEDRDSIAKKLLADLRGGKSAEPTAPKARKPRAAKAPAPKLPEHKPSKGEDLVATPALARSLSRHVQNTHEDYRDNSADSELAAIGALQGYDDVPTVASKDEMDRLLATGDYVEIWRGVGSSNVDGGMTAAEIHEAFRSAPTAFYGWGIYGNGYYFAQSRTVAEQYSDGSPGSILRALIPKSARTRTHDDVKTGQAILDEQYRKEGTSADPLFYDEGHFAAGKGLDGIEIPRFGFDGTSAYNWLNRSVLIVEEG